MMSAKRGSWRTKRSTYVIGLQSSIRVHVAVSDFSIDCGPQLSGYVSQKVRFGTRMSFNHADITYVEEENEVEMGVLRRRGSP